MPVTVHEVRMRTPRCLELVVRDADVARQSPQLVELAEASTTAYDVVTTEYNDLPGRVYGYEKKHIELLVNRLSAYLDRDDADDFANYTLDFGTVSCTSITRRSTDVIDRGLYQVSGNTLGSCSQFSHELRFHLDGDLPDGTAVTITPPNSAFPTVSWTFDDLDTHCPSIHVNSHGHGPHDAAKHATISFWDNGFGTEGITDFLALLDPPFHLIDSEDSIVFTGEITLRKEEDSPELTGQTYGMLEDSGTDLMRIVSTTHGFAVTGVTKASTAVVTAPGHDFANGDIVHFLYMAGMNEVNFFTTGDNRYTVAGVSGDTFELSGIDSSAYGTYTSGGYVYGERLTNGAGTHTYDLDYSGFEAPKIGVQYRLYIPGMGVSYPFYIDEAMYYLAAKKAFGGHFNIRNGIAKNGEFNYTAPQNLRGGVNPGLTFYQSNLPLPMSANSNGSVSESAGGLSPWITATERNEIWGGYQDAGDWDVRAGHIRIIHLMLEMRDLIPLANFNVSFGVPKSSLYVDSEFWGDISTLPDIVQECIFHFDFWRRCRTETGEVSGGYEFSDGAEHVSWITPSIPYVYYPDPDSTYRFAAAAAHLSHVVGEYGLTTLEASLLALAEGSFDRAEEIMAPADSYAAMDAFFATASGINGTAYTNRRASIITDCENNSRLLAAGYLYLATREEAYRTITEGGANPSSTSLDGIAFQYVLSDDPNKNGTTSDSWEATIIGIGDTAITNAAYAYENTKQPGDAPVFGTGLPIRYNAHRLMRAYVLTEDEKYLKPLLRAFNFMLGGNPQNMSYIRGLGQNQVTGILNVDTLRTGQEAPEGMTIFGPIIWNVQAQNNLIGRGPDDYFAHHPSPRNAYGAADAAWDADKKMLEPIPGQTPLWEYMVKTPYIVRMMEFAPEQITRCFQMCLFLWGYKGAPSTALGSKTRLFTRWGAA